MVWASFLLCCISAPECEGKSAPLKVNLNNTASLRPVCCSFIPQPKLRRHQKLRNSKPRTSCCPFAPLHFQVWLECRKLLLRPPRMMESVGASRGGLGAHAGGRSRARRTVELFAGLDTTRRGLGAVDHRTADTAKLGITAKLRQLAKKLILSDLEGVPIAVSSLKPSPFVR